MRVAVFVLLLLTSPARDLAAAASWDEQDKPTRPERRIYVGMWTYHFREPQRALDQNWLVGLSWGRVYGATFVNSFGKRAFTAGVQGDWIEAARGPMSFGVGYRAGLITGYDERFIPLAGLTPVLPMFQPLLRMDTGPMGLELSYSGVVASAAMNVRF